MRRAAGPARGPGVLRGSGAGVGIGALGLALALAAATFDSPSLYVPGVALVALAALAAGWVWLAARGARVERRAGPRTIEEEQPYPLRVEVHTGVLPPPGGELFEPLLGWPVPIGGRWSRRVRINVRFSRRGRRELEPSKLVIRDPLRLAERTVEGEGGERLLVLPRVEPVRAAGGGGAAAGRSRVAGSDDVGAHGRLYDSVAELEFEGLRPYREGTPASRIHWPAVARSGEMLERRLSAGADSAPLVVLDPTRPASEAALDAAVRAAASLCVELARAGGSAVLLPHDRRPTQIDQNLAAWSQVHARLALVEASDGRPSLSRARRSGAVIWISAGRSGRPPRVLERMGAPLRLFVTPLPPRGVRSEFTVAGCSGYAVGHAAPARRRAA